MGPDCLLSDCMFCFVSSDCIVALRLLTASYIKYGGFLMVGGRLGDIFGQVTTFQIAMFFFNVFALTCALSPNQVGLVVARALQGRVNIDARIDLAISTVLYGE